MNDNFIQDTTRIGQIKNRVLPILILVELDHLYTMNEKPYYFVRE